MIKKTLNNILEMEKYIFTKVAMKQIVLKMIG
jgi:hypothetical protein